MHYSLECSYLIISKARLCGGIQEYCTFHTPVELLLLLLCISLVLGTLILYSNSCLSFSLLRYFCFGMCHGGVIKRKSKLVKSNVCVDLLSDVSLLNIVFLRSLV